MLRRLGLLLPDLPILMAALFAMILRILMIILIGQHRADDSTQHRAYHRSVLLAVGRRILVCGMIVVSVCAGRCGGLGIGQAEMGGYFELLADFNPVFVSESIVLGNRLGIVLAAGGFLGDPA